MEHATGGVLAKATITGTTRYLYGHDCLGEVAGGGWLYYLADGGGYVRQGADEQGQAGSSWLFDPDGSVLEGPKGPASHLVCGRVYDLSTGLIYKNSRCFDPTLRVCAQYIIIRTPITRVPLPRRLFRSLIRLEVT